MQNPRDPAGNRAGTPIRVTTLIPVKSLEHGKSRLSHQLDLSNRIQLTRDSLRRLVHILSGVPSIERVVVVSRDDQVAEWAGAWRVTHLREHQTGLNAALREARARFASAPAILVLPSDLIALSAADVQAMVDIASAAPARSVVIAPDRHGQGTNALLLRPPDVIDFEFGRDSAQRHAAHARARGVEPVWYRSDSVSLDLDSPEDLDLYWDQW